MYTANSWFINPLNAELNPICHLLALLGAHPIFHVRRIRVKVHHVASRKRFTVFAKLGKATIKSVVFVCPFVHMEQVDYHWMDFN
jgi:hypothetical protein